MTIRNSPLILLALGLMMGLLQLLPAEFLAALEFDRKALGAGQYWRLLSSNLVHLNGYHWLLNAAGLMLIGFLLRDENRSISLLLALLWCATWVGVGLWWLADDLDYYRGFSGVLHGLILLAPWWSRYLKTSDRWLFLLALSGKILWEQSPWFENQQVANMIGGHVETRAHLLGYLAGLAWLALAQFSRWKCR
ncbi:MAG: rhombosortase [Oceanobacter sp.]